MAGKIAKSGVVNIHEVINSFPEGNVWKSPHRMEKCLICGMTAPMLGTVRGQITDDSCADYINEQLVIVRGAIVQMQLSKIGFRHDVMVALEGDGHLTVHRAHECLF